MGSLGQQNFWSSLGLMERLRPVFREVSKNAKMPSKIPENFWNEKFVHEFFSCCFCSGNFWTKNLEGLWKPPLMNLRLKDGKTLQIHFLSKKLFVVSRNFQKNGPDIFYGNNDMSPWILKCSIRMERCENKEEIANSSFDQLFIQNKPRLALLLNWSFVVDLETFSREGSGIIGLRYRRWWNKRIYFFLSKELMGNCWIKQKEGLIQKYYWESATKFWRKNFSLS